MAKKIASRLSPGVLEQMHASGELARKAKEMPDDATQADFARAIGMTPDAYVCAIGRWKRQGRVLPTYAELRAIPGEGTGVPDSGIQRETKPTVQDSAESSTKAEPSSAVVQPPIPRWIGKSLAAFDAEPDEQAADNREAHSLAPDGYHVKGVSTLYDADGLVRARWVKTNKESDGDSRAYVFEAVSNLAAGWPLTANAVELPTHSDDDLLCVYPMGDPHIGMLAWAPETGENFDLAIAERNLVNAVDHLALLAPPARRALIATVGDTFHSDGLSNTTTKGTRVDVDGRTRKMIDVGVRTFRRVIDRALQKHEEVEVKIAPGNHDALLSIVLQIALQQFYEREPRVRVDPSPESFLWYRFGLNLIGVNHGHLAKDDALMQAMAVDRSEDWGQTRHRRIYKGHFHHEVTKEVPGCTIDTLNTLASSDDWHRRSAYRSTRHMRMDIVHRQFGLVNRHIVGIEQLMASAA